MHCARLGVALGVRLQRRHTLLVLGEVGVELPVQALDALVQHTRRAALTTILSPFFEELVKLRKDRPRVVVSRHNLSLPIMLSRARMLKK